MGSKYEHIVNYLRIFEQSLDDKHEVGIIIAPYNRPFPLAVTRGGGEDFIFFELVNDDNDTFAVVCHYSQLNFAIVPLPKEKTEQTARRIGFLQDTLR